MDGHRGRDRRTHERGKTGGGVHRKKNAGKKGHESVEGVEATTNFSSDNSFLLTNILPGFTPYELELMQTNASTIMYMDGTKTNVRYNTTIHDDSRIALMAINSRAPAVS